MALPDSSVTLTVGAASLVLDTWGEYTVTHNMLQAGTPITFNCWHSESRGSTWQVLTNDVKLGDEMLLTIDGLRQLHGMVETREIVVPESGGAQFVLGGRDYAGSAMTWDCDPTQGYKGLTLEDALTRLFEPLDIAVTIASSSAAAAHVGTLCQPRRNTWARTHRTSKVDLTHPSPGEKVWALADKIVRKAGYLIWTAPGTSANSVALIVDSPNNSGTSQYEFKRELASDGSVTQDSNILSSRYPVQIRDVPTHVTVYADAPRGDAQATRIKRTTLNGYLLSDSVTRGLVRVDLHPQPLHVVSPRARTLNAAHSEADRYIAESMAKFRIYHCKVQGHYQMIYGERVPYALNTIAHVRDDISGVVGDWLITGVEFHGSRESGQVTNLTMVPRGALVILPRGE